MTRFVNNRWCFILSSISLSRVGTVGMVILVEPLIGKFRIDMLEHAIHDHMHTFPVTGVDHQLIDNGVSSIN